MPYTTDGKNEMLDALGALITHAGLHTAQPSTGTPNEVTGGSPAYARKAITWGAAGSGTMDSSNAPVFDVPADTTVTHVGFWSASSGGTLLAWHDAVDEVFGAQGTYTLSDADLDLNA
jgi:hypothetical protein